MAKITCPECLTQVEDTESVCPRCGHLLSRETYSGEPIYIEEKPWTAGNTFVVLLLTLLILAVGAFLFFYGLKFPYEDAKNYYVAEKEAYEEQLDGYRDKVRQIETANVTLDSRIEQMTALLNSGEEPLDPETITTVQNSINRARSARITPPVIEATETPEIDDNTILRFFHAKQIQETGKLIDQQRYSLYQQYGDIQTPDYAAVLSGMERAEEAFRESVQRNHELDGVSARFKEEMDEYEAFMTEYIDFMAAYQRGDSDSIDRANELQTKYMYYVNRTRAINRDWLQEADRNYLDVVLARVNEMMEKHHLTEDMLREH